MKRSWIAICLFGVFLSNCQNDIRLIDPNNDGGADADSEVLPDGDADESVECDEGHADCNGNSSDGCEVNLLNDISNCGRCGNDCHDLPNVSVVSCDAGFCMIDVCDDGFDDMDGDPANGCEEEVCVITFGAHEVSDGIDNDCDGRIDEESDSLIFYASLDDFSGGIVLDHSSYENHGTVNGEMSYASESIFGRAIEFDSHNFVEFENIDALNGLAQGTWMVWVQVFDEGIERLMMPFSKEGCYQFAWWPDGYYFNFGYGNSSDGWATYFSPEETLEANRWYYLAVTYDGSEFRFYINGSQAASRLSSGEISEFPTNLFIGADRRGSREFVGLIDEVAVYNRPWSEEEINYYYSLFAP